MKRFLNTLEKLLMASVMAEAGAFDLGRAYLQTNTKAKTTQNNLQSFLHTVGLDQVRVYYGIAQM